MKIEQNIIQLQKANQKRNSKIIANKIPISLSKKLRQQKNASEIENQFNIKNIFRAAKKLFVCKICNRNFQLRDTGILGKCGHTFCTQCLIHYQILCPEENCEIELQEDFYFLQLLPSKMRQKWKEQKKWRQIMKNPNLKLCPNQSCRNGIVDLLLAPPQCIQCHRKYCKQCMMEFHKGSCQNNFEKYFSNLRRCPLCKIFIQKTEGCDHIRCKCKYQFCYLCGRVWTYNHVLICRGKKIQRFQYQNNLDEGQNRNEDSQFWRISKWIQLLKFIGLVILYLLFMIIAFVLFVIGLLLTPFAGIILLPSIIIVHLLPILKIPRSIKIISVVIWLPLGMIAGIFVIPVIIFSFEFLPLISRISSWLCAYLSRSITRLLQ